jgi:hypothetical protein
MMHPDHFDAFMLAMIAGGGAVILSMAFDLLSKLGVLQ